MQYAPPPSSQMNEQSFTPEQQPPDPISVLMATFAQSHNHNDSAIIALFKAGAVEGGLLDLYNCIENKELFFETIACCTWDRDVVICLVKHVSSVPCATARHMKLRAVFDSAAERGIITHTINMVMSHDVLRRDVILEPSVCCYLATFLRIYITALDDDLGWDFASLSFVVAFFQPRILDCVFRIEDAYIRNFVFRAYSTIKAIQLPEFQNLKTGMSCGHDKFDIPLEWIDGYRRQSIEQLTSMFSRI